MWTVCPLPCACWQWKGNVHICVCVCDVWLCDDAYHISKYKQFFTLIVVYHPLHRYVDKVVGLQLTQSASAQTVRQHEVRRSEQDREIGRTLKQVTAASQRQLLTLQKVVIVRDNLSQACKYVNSAHVLTNVYYNFLYRTTNNKCSS